MKCVHLQAEESNSEGLYEKREGMDEGENDQILSKLERQLKVVRKEIRDLTQERDDLKAQE